MKVLITDYDFKDLELERGRARLHRLEAKQPLTVVPPGRRAFPRGRRLPRARAVEEYRRLEQIVGEVLHVRIEDHREFPCWHVRGDKFWRDFYRNPCCGAGAGVELRERPVRGQQACDENERNRWTFHALPFRKFSNAIPQNDCQAAGLATSGKT